MAETITITSGSNDVSHERKEYTAHQLLMRLPKALMGGTEAMRAAGTDYLAQEAGESDTKYLVRLNRSFLYEGYSRTIEKLAGEVFREDVDISEEMPDDHKEWMEDADMEGSSITVFMKEVFEEAIHAGASFIMVDYPDVGGNTWADHKKVGAHPYLVLIKADQIIGWRFEGRGAGRKLAQLRIKETHEVNEGTYGVDYKERIRVLEPGSWTIYEEQETDGKTEWKIAADENGNEMQGATSLDEIPVRTIILGNRLSDMTCRPPLLPLAYLNRAHWESASDQRNILHYARLITYFGRMLEEPEGGGQITVGANNLIQSEDPNGDFRIVEHSGAAIASGREDLKDLEMAMSLYGLNLMLPKTGNTTATEKAIDKGESDSVLHSWGRLLDALMTQVYELMCKYVNTEPAGTMKSNDSFKNILSSQDAEVLLKAYQLGLLSREIVIEELKARKVLTTEIDLQDLVAELEANQKTNTDLTTLTGFGQSWNQQEGQ